MLGGGGVEVLLVHVAERDHLRALALKLEHAADDMIALAAAMRLQSGMQQPTMHYAFDVKPRWPLAAL